MNALTIEQHRIAIAEEAVARSDGVGVERHHVRVACEGANEHHERALGQMKVGQQPIDHAELEARGDEDVRVSASGFKRAAEGSGFERAQGGGADGDDAVAGGACGGDGVNRCLAHLEPLAVHHVLCEVLAVKSETRQEPISLDLKLRKVNTLLIHHLRLL